MAFKNFATDKDQEAVVRALLADGEQLVAIVEEEHRFISVTTARVILHEKSGGYSVIRNSLIAGVEVSDADDDESYVKIFFGGGLSRTLKAPSAEQANVIASAAAL